MVVFHEPRASSPFSLPLPNRLGNLVTGMFHVVVGGGGESTRDLGRMCVTNNRIFKFLDCFTKLLYV